MTFTETPLAGAYTIDFAPVRDERGHFVRTFCAQTFRRKGLVFEFPQANQSLTKQAGAVRGLHFRYPPQAEVKLVRCTRGVAWDVMIDLRARSRSFLNWHAVELREEDLRAVYIPAGFAHGFQTLADDCELQYLMSSPYDPSADGRIHHLDPRIGIHWPQPITIVSPSDAAAPVSAPDFYGLEYG